MMMQAKREAHLAPHDRKELANINRNPITAHDLVKLRREWLNDDVVNAYCRLVTDREAAKGNKIAVVPTSFWVTYSQRGWKAVARWPKRAGCGPGDMEKCTRVFMPVNPGSHWFFGCINVRQRRFEVYDSLNNRNVLTSHRRVYEVRFVLFFLCRLISHA